MNLPLRLEMKGLFASEKVAVPLCFGLGFIITWLVTALVRTSLLLGFGGLPLPWSEIPKVSLSLFAPELILLFLATFMKVAVLGIPMAASDLKKGCISIEEIFGIGFKNSVRKTLRAVAVATSFSILVFLLIKPVDGQRYHESFVAEMAIGTTAEKVFLPDRVVDISQGGRVPENIRALIEAVAVGHFSLAAFLIAVCFIRLMRLWMSIDHAPTVFFWRRQDSPFPVPRGGGRTQI